MLVFNRKIGQTIHIGDDVCLTVFDKLRYHITLGVVASATTNLRLGATEIRPAILDDGSRFYMLSLLSGDAFSIDDIEIVVKFRSSGLSSLGAGSKQVRIAVQAPAHIPVHRGEIYRRIERAEGRAAPVLEIAAWLHQANASMSHRPSGVPVRTHLGAKRPADAEFIFV